MALTRRQIATILSVVYLGALTGIAAYAAHQSTTLSLPISSSLTTLTLALAPLAGLCMETSTALATSLAQHPKLRHRHARNIPAVLLPSTLTILALTIYITVIATLSGSHISPVGGLGCALREKWQGMFRDKNEDRIKRIQDVFECCGFAGPRDMAWPFPARGVGSDACVVRFERTEGCLGAWRQKERVVAGLMVGVAVGVFVWIALIVATPAVHPTWAHESMRLPHRIMQERELNQEDDNNTLLPADENRVIEYPTAAAASARYTDNPEEEEVTRREIDDLNNESRLALRVERSREHRPSKMLGEEGVWRGSDGA